MDMSIVVPCYNEAGNVARIRQELFPVAAELAEAYCVELVFVDDGSTDGTWQALQDLSDGAQELRLALRFERHGVNQGLGAALRTGFAAASGDVIVTVDCDGTYRFSEIPVLLACLTPHVDIVTASPYHPAGGVDGVAAHRLVLSRGSSGIYRVLLDRRLHTYTSLFRAYRREVIERVSFESNGRYGTAGESHAHGLSSS
jgi:dolichol-phosphate mannosyltransferase